MFLPFLTLQVEGSILGVDFDIFFEFSMSDHKRAPIHSFTNRRSSRTQMNAEEVRKHQQ